MNKFTVQPARLLLRYGARIAAHLNKETSYIRRRQETVPYFAIK
jgi:hypothetical protein